ncbi:MAG TPA: hypothetical protein VK927_04810 [Adhaeribacter sp.]|nr:hypothetical protein [Adhaeribacter sp.]
MATSTNSGTPRGNAAGDPGKNLLDGLNNVPDMLKKYSDTAVKAVSNLSTTQKVIGGAVLVLGAGYLSRKAGLIKTAGRLATAAWALKGKGKK